MERFEECVRLAHRGEPVACFREHPFGDFVISCEGLDVGRDFLESVCHLLFAALRRDLKASGSERSCQIEITQAGMHVGEGVGNRHLDRAVVRR